MFCGFEIQGNIDYGSDVESKRHFGYRSQLLGIV